MSAQGSPFLGLVAVVVCAIATAWNFPGLLKTVVSDSPKDGLAMLIPLSYSFLLNLSELAFSKHILSNRTDQKKNLRSRILLKNTLSILDYKLTFLSNN